MHPRLRTELTRRIGLDVPIFLAPMASVVTVPLAAAVAQAGGLGALGCAYMQPEAIESESAKLRKETDRPFQLNFFVAPQPDPIAADAQRDAIAAASKFFKELGLPEPEPVKAPYAPNLDAQLDAALRVRPAVVTFHLNVMASARVRAFQQAGALVGGSATCVEEAKNLEALGVDFIVAQGGEAGGHRGTWTRDPHSALTGTLALTRLIVSAVNTPVVAAGGIMDGAGVAAALALGAQAAQLGTAFIACPESAASEHYRAALLDAREDDTTITDRVSGKPARGLRNRYITEAARADYAKLVFPAQNQLTSKLRTAAAQAGNKDLMVMWAGQAAALSRRLPAGELLRTLEREALEAIERLNALKH